MLRLCYFIAVNEHQPTVLTQVKALAKELVVRGHRVILLLDHGSQEAEDHQNNPAIYAWPCPWPGKRHNMRFFAKLIQDYRPNCLIGNYAATNQMLIAGWLMRVPRRLAWYRSLSAQRAMDDIVSTRWQIVRRWMIHLLATHILAVSEAARKDAMRHFPIVAPPKCRVFYNSLPDPLAHPQLSEAAAKKTQGIICVGRMVPSKGQDILIKAIASLKRELPDIRVEFVGAGPLQESCRQLARDLGVERHCAFVSWMSHAEVLRKMASAAVAVLPSRSEAFGRVNLESMAVGTPVLASDVGGISEIVQDGINGFLIPPEDPHALADRLKMLILNQSLCKRLSENARSRFLSRFEQSKLIPEQARWLETIAGEPGS